MAVVLECWATDDSAKQELSKRLTACIRDKRDLEQEWDEVDTLYYNYFAAITPGGGGVTTSAQGLTSIYGQTDTSDADNSNSDITMSYGFKNLRFIHSQLAGNPPAATPRPASSDPEDLRKADAADRIIRHALRTYNIQDKIDRGTLNTLQYGTAIFRTEWDFEKGDILECDDDGNLVMEGDFSMSVVNPRHFYIDPDAECWDDVRFVFQKFYVPFDEAVHKFGKEKAEMLKNFRRQVSQETSGKKFDVVEVYEYWEKGMPLNGYAGRYACLLQDGSLLAPLKPSPYAFGRHKDTAEKCFPKKAKLPFHLLTDVDVPHKVWGKSFLYYVNRLQDFLNKLDTGVLDALQAHGTYRMVLPEGTELAADSPSNSPWEVVKITGNQPPYFVSPPQMPADMSRMRDQLKQGIDDLSGVNESMFGQQSRETAQFAMQYAVNQGSQIRKRLFIKYAMAVESIYKDYLLIVRDNWDTKRKVQVLGRGKALETADFEGADVDGGFDIVVEYGASLSLDPITRREEIIQLQPLFEKAGIPVRTSLKLMRLNELSEQYDLIELAETRQQNYFEKMVATNKYVAPEQFEDHENMLIYCKQYIMQEEFDALSPDLKHLIRMHMIERAKMKAVDEQTLGMKPPAGGASADMMAAMGAPPPAAPMPGPGGGGIPGT